MYQYWGMDCISLRYIVKHHYLSTCSLCGTQAVTHCSSKSNVYTAQSQPVHIFWSIYMGPTLIPVFSHAELGTLSDEEFRIHWYHRCFSKCSTKQLLSVWFVSCTIWNFPLTMTTAWISSPTVLSLNMATSPAHGSGLTFRTGNWPILYEICPSHILLAFSPDPS